MTRAGDALAMAQLVRWVDRQARRPARDVEREQVACVGALVHHASTNIRFYRELYTAVGGAPRIRSFDDVRRLPIIDRFHIVDRPRDDLASGPFPAGGVRHGTSGTTGMPIRVEWTPGRARLARALDLRRTRARGGRFREPLVIVDRGDTISSTVALRQRILRVPISMPPREAADAIAAFGPRVLRGYGCVLGGIGWEAGDRIRPRIVATGGHQLDALLRRQLQQIYGAPVVDNYGAWETGSIAWQCREADLYHVNHETTLVELVDDDGRPVPAGVDADVVVTTLRNAHMPFIRYRLGDRARFATRPCRCGYALPALELVGGRVTDWFRAADGHPVAPFRLAISEHASRQLTDRVRRYQVRQDASGAVVVAVELHDPIGDDEWTAIVASYRRVLGDGVPVGVVYEDLPVRANGKFRQYVSDAAPTAGRV